MPHPNLWIYLKISKGSITFPVNISQYVHGLAKPLARKSHRLPQFYCADPRRGTGGRGTLVASLYGTDTSTL